MVWESGHARAADSAVGAGKKVCPDARLRRSDSLVQGGRRSWADDGDVRTRKALPRGPLLQGQKPGFCLVYDWRAVRITRKRARSRAAGASSQPSPEKTRTADRAAMDRTAPRQRG